ncbi:helix-turn-helix transcriptional regulator [Thioalkalivibrio sp.]|uniref:helix-turn-helix transcriptional regulator n=1 Tax=Thioalkalivibrio sp. TaxID=2093813 RepID=UPI00356537A5
MAERLIRLLIKLNEGQALELPALAREFDVSLRTVQRDLQRLSAHLPLEVVEGRYRLTPSALGRLSTKELSTFASLSGIDALFPSLSGHDLPGLLAARDTMLVRGHHYEDLHTKAPRFRDLQKAIIDRRLLTFHYTSHGETKAYQDAKPYKLLNNKGIWYLAASHRGKLKTFCFAKLTGLHVQQATYTPDPDVERIVTEQEGVWLGETRTTVKIRVDSEVAPYFIRRPLLPNQRILNELEDGALIVSAEVGHENQILPVVRYWIPHLTLEKPAAWQSLVIESIQAYLHRFQSCSPYTHQ